MRYFYVTFLTPIGPGAKYVRSDAHPFHPGVEIPFRADIARDVTVQIRGQLVPPEMIFLQSVHELETEVAMARWPQDFIAPTPAVGDGRTAEGYRTAEIPDT